MSIITTKATSGGPTTVRERRTTTTESVDETVIGLRIEKDRYDHAKKQTAKATAIDRERQRMNEQKTNPNKQTRGCSPLSFSLSLSVLYT